MNEKQYSRIEQLSAEQRQHVIRNLKTRLLNSNEVELGPREGRTAPVPLSYAQHRLWTFQQIHPESRAYNEFTAFRFEGRLKLDVLEQSLDSIVERHEALRSRFQEKNGLPIQVTVSDTSANLKVIDLTDIPATKKLSQVKSIADQESNHLFQLDCEPPLRLTLVRLADDQNFLLVAAHHLILDGWSIDIFRRELALLYCAIDEGQPSPLPDLPIQYADYAVWQRGWLAGHELQRQLSYWEEQLSGAPALLSLPTDHARPAVQSFNGAHINRTYSPELGEKLRALAGAEDCTLFMLLLA
ncbi:MAG: condensation domain-containing protein, partial [Pseudomonadota bacterium]